ncbi:MAG: RrF2 family transcriptional regulator [Alphaproteobacteria bacterium]
MLRLSKKRLFAIEAVVDIAYHAGSEPVRSNDISRRQGIPRRALDQVLQELVHKGILGGQRGPRGGYRLARERRRITVGDIMRVVGALESATDPVDEADGSDIAVKVIRPLWNDLQHEIMDRLDALTVEDLCTRARDLHVPSEAPRIPDFSI